MPVSPLAMANAIRALSMDAVHRARSGHQGMPLGAADVATALWSRFLKFDAGDPTWPDRDRFVLSAGHGSMLLYALLHLTGFKAMTMAEIENFRQWGSLTPGHPEYGHTPGVETTTGPLGQGLATAVGLAMAERALAARFGDDLFVKRRIFGGAFLGRKDRQPHAVEMRRALEPVEHLFVVGLRQRAALGVHRVLRKRGFQVRDVPLQRAAKARLARRDRPLRDAEAEREQ